MKYPPPAHPGTSRGSATMPSTRPPPPRAWAVVVALASLRLAGCARELRPLLPAPHHPPPAFATPPLLSKPVLGGGAGWRLDAGGMTRTQRRVGPSRDGHRGMGSGGPRMMAWKLAKKDRRRFPEDVWKQVSSPLVGLHGERDWGLGSRVKGQIRWR